MTIKNEALLTYADLSHNFDLAICSVESDSGSDDLYQLGLILHVVGIAKKDSFCSITSDALGSAYSAFLSFFPLIATPYPLSKEMQRSYAEIYKTAKDETVEQLKNLKIEFCENTQINWENVVKSIGVIQFHAGILSRKHGNVMRLNQGATALPLPPE